MRIIISRLRLLGQVVNSSLSGGPSFQGIFHTPVYLQPIDTNPPSPSFPLVIEQIELKLMAYSASLKPWLSTTSLVMAGVSVAALLMAPF